VDDLRSLRIAVVAPPSFARRGYLGVDAVVSDLKDALEERGHEVVTVRGTEPSARVLAEVTHDGADDEPSPEVVHAANVRRAFQSLSRGKGFDVVHDHTLAGALSARSFRERGVPTVVTVHTAVDDELSAYYGTFGRDVSLVAISDRQRARAPELNWVGRVYNAVRVEDWPFHTRKGDYAVFVGRFDMQTAPHLALQAAHAVGVPLVLAGKCTEPVEKAYFSTWIQPHLTVNDLMFGQADVAARRELFAGARCLIFPSRSEEPFGRVMTEAMACGTPVVALDRGAAPELVDNGVTGFVCKEPEELGAALQRAMQLDPQACRRHVKEKFGAEQLALGYERIYRRVLTSSRI